jgi:anti-sigma B factor antagonist
MGASEGIVWFLRAAEEELGAARLIVLEGRVSHATAPDLENALSRRFTAGRPVIVDLTGVDYMNGAGLRVFEAAAARCNGSGSQLVICGLRPAVHAAFRLVGEIPHLVAADSRDDALAAAFSAKADSR